MDTASQENPKHMEANQAWEKQTRGKCHSVYWETFPAISLAGQQWGDPLLPHQWNWCGADSC